MKKIPRYLIEWYIARNQVLLTTEQLTEAIRNEAMSNRAGRCLLILFGFLLFGVALQLMNLSPALRISHDFVPKAIITVSFVGMIVSWTIWRRMIAKPYGKEAQDAREAYADLVNAFGKKILNDPKAPSPSKLMLEDREWVTIQEIECIRYGEAASKVVLAARTSLLAHWLLMTIQKDMRSLLRATEGRAKQADPNDPYPASDPSIDLLSNKIDAVRAFGAFSDNIEPRTFTLPIGPAKVWPRNMEDSPNVGRA